MADAVTQVQRALGAHTEEQGRKPPRPAAIRKASPLHVPHSASDEQPGFVATELRPKVGIIHDQPSRLAGGIPVPSLFAAIHNEPAVLPGRPHPVLLLPFPPRTAATE